MSSRWVLPVVVVLLAIAAAAYLATRNTAAPTSMEASEANPANIPQLRKAVAAGDWKTANAQEEALSKAGPAWVPELASILHDTESTEKHAKELRMRAASVLGRIGGADALRALSAAWRNEPEPEVQGQVLLGLSQLTGNETEAGLQALHEALQDAGRTDEVRRSAALLLGKHSAKKAAERLAEAAKQDGEAKRTRWCAEALGFSPHAQTAGAVLRELYTAGNEAQRSAALCSLARLHARSGHELSTLEPSILAERSPAVRREVMGILCEQLFEGRAALFSATALRQDTDQGVRALAARALGKRGDPKDLEVLRTALQTETVLYVRLKCVEAIGLIGGPTAKKALSDLAASDAHATERSAARTALARLRGDTKPVPEQAEKDF